MVKLLAVTTLLICGSCSWYESYPSDNAIEELTEAVIRYETGLDVDLSPFSPEE